MLAVCRAPLYTEGEMKGERDGERKIESERERDRVRKPELFEGLPDGRFVEKTAWPADCFFGLRAGSLVSPVVGWPGP